MYNLHEGLNCKLALTICSMRASCWIFFEGLSLQKDLWRGAVRLQARLRSSWSASSSSSCTSGWPHVTRRGRQGRRPKKGGGRGMAGFWVIWLGPPVVQMFVLPLFLARVPLLKWTTEKVGTLIPTSLLEDLVGFGVLTDSDTKGADLP